MKHALLIRGSLFLLTLIASAFDGSCIYGEIVLWGNGTRIMRTNFASGVTTELLSTQGVVNDLTLDLPNGKVYWSDGEIWRANLDGSNAEHLVTNFGVIGIALDTVNDHIYWTENSHQNMWRSNLDGTSIEECTSSALPCPTDPKLVAVDSSAGKVYWTVNQGIQSANIDGSGFQNLYDIQGDNTRGVALDAANGHLYFSRNSSEKILRIEVDDGSVDTLIDYSDHVYEPIPQHLAFEPMHGGLFWFEADSDNPGIFPDNLVRYDVETGVIDRLFIESHPAPLAVYVPEPRSLLLAISAAAWLFLGSASGILHRRSRRAAKC